MKLNRLVTPAFAILVAVVFEASCGAPAPTPQPVPDTPTFLPPATSTASPPTLTAVPPTQVPRPTATAPEPFAVVTEAGQVFGTWTGSGSDFTRFDEDGTYREASKLAQLNDAPFAISSYEFQDGRFITREVSVSGVPSCGGKVGSYELRLLQSGKLQIVLIKDSCEARAGDTVGIFERVP